LPLAIASPFGFPGRNMILKASVPPARITVKRLAAWTMILFPIVFLPLSLWFWVESRIPDWYYWKAELFFLLAAEVAYLAAASTAAVGTAIVGVLFVRQIHERRRRAVLARPLLLCVSVVLASFAIEVACGVWQVRQHHGSAMPVGGFSRNIGQAPESRFRTPAADVALRTDFPDPPGDREIDLVILGESSAEGVPYTNWVSPSSLLTWKMSQAFPGRPIRARVIARSGDTLEWQHRELANLSRRPDLLIIYCGHNEFTARLAESREHPYYFDDWLPTGWEMLVDQVEWTSSVCGLIRETSQKCRIAIPPATTGLRKLVDVPFYTSTEYHTLLVDFERRLEAIVSYAEHVGALIVLILPAANDRGFEPSRSFLPAATSRAERESFQQDFTAVRRLETEAPDTAIGRYRSLLARYSDFAETHFRLGRLLEQKGEWDEAYQHYVAARDYDGYPMRCLSEFQQVYRDVASRHDCILIDSQSYFHAIGRHGLLDDELFQDAMHPSLRGQITLAQAVLQSLRTRRAFGWPQEGPVPVIDPAECTAHFGLDSVAWRVMCLWGIKFNSLVAPLTYDLTRRLEARVAYAVAADRIAAGEAPEALGLSNIGIPAPVPQIPSTASHAVLPRPK
jgi:tetratricopeptide (TPR) repeat protein